MTAVKPSDRFEVNSPAVVSEVIDGEAVIMNLKSGHYFSIQGSGAMIWDWIGQGCSVDALVNSTGEAFLGEPVDLETHVLRFIDSLLKHELIRLMVKVDETTDCPAPSIGADQPPIPFEVPVLEVFNDMQDLLLLDPIHDVDEAGWPRLKEDEHGAHS